MSRIDREATFRGYIVEQAVGLTKNEFPQLIARFVAAELYDEDVAQWIDWSEYEADITDYMCLVGGKGETLTCQQLAKALPWSGTSFQELNDGDYTKALVQFRVEEEEYEGKTSLRVKWIDTADAVPGRAIRKLNTAELKAIDAKFTKILGPKKAPAKAPTGKPSTPKKTVVKNGVKPTQSAGPVKSPDIPAASPATEINGMTKQEAWDSVCAQTVNVPDRDEKLAAAWHEAIAVIGEGKEELTSNQWATIAVKVVDDVGGDPTIPF